MAISREYVVIINYKATTKDGIEILDRIRDLVSLMKALQLAPAHLVGCSFGAYICLLVARDHPELIRALTICEPPLLPLLGLSVPPKPSQMLGLFMRAP